MENDNMWVQRVLQNLLFLVEKEEVDAGTLKQVLDDMLDDLLNDDFFGSEGQLDPRGDRRDI